MGENLPLLHFLPPLFLLLVSCSFCRCDESLMRSHAQKIHIEITEEDCNCQNLKVITSNVTCRGCVFRNENLFINANSRLSISFSNCTFTSYSPTTAALSIQISIAPFQAEFTNCDFQDSTLGAVNVTTIYASSTFNITFQGCTFTNNTWSGGFLGGGSASQFSLYGGSGFIWYDNCLFWNNTDFGWGGALGIHGYGKVEVLITNSLFEDNTGLYGGAVDFEISGTLSISNTTFRNNLALFGFGGAINFQGDSISIQDSLFKNNSALGGLDSGRMALGGALTLTASNGTFRFVDFVHNQANFGGGVGIMGSGNQYAQFEHCTFTSNFAIEGGAFAIGVQGSFHLTVCDTSFVANGASAEGGVLAVYNGYLKSDFQRCLFLGNYAFASGGLFDLAILSELAIVSSVIDDTMGLEPSNVEGVVFFINSGSSVILNHTTITGTRPRGGRGLAAYISVGALLAHNCTFTYNIPSPYTQYYTTELFYLDTNPQNRLTVLNCLLVQSAGLVISGNTSLVTLVNTTVVLYNNTVFTNEQVFSASKIFGCTFWSSSNDTIILTDQSLVINTTFNAFGAVMDYPVVSLQGDSNFENVEFNNCNVSIFSAEVVSSSFLSSELTISGTVSFEKTFFGDSTVSILEGTATLFDCPFSPRNQTPSIDITAGVLYVSQSSFCPHNVLGTGVSCLSNSKGRVIGDSSAWNVSSNCIVTKLYPLITNLNSSLSASVCRSLLFLIEQTEETASLGVTLSSSSVVPITSSLGIWEEDSQSCAYAGVLTNSDSLSWYMSPPNKTNGQLITYCCWVNATVEPQTFEFTAKVDYFPRLPDLNQTQISFVNSFVFNFQKPTLTFQFFDQLGFPISISNMTQPLNVSVELPGGSYLSLSLSGCHTECQISLPSISNRWRPWGKVTAQLMVGSQAFGNVVTCTVLSVLFIPLVLLTVLIAFTSYRVIRAVKQYKARLNSQYELLESKDVEIAELTEIWRIEEKDIEWKEFLSAGAFGDVWKCTWNDIPVAVKKLQSHWLESDPSAIQDFEQEVKFLRSIRHINIVLFYGAGKLGDSTPFLVTEFISRGSLFSLLSESPEQITFERKLGFLIDAAAGMAFLHSSNPPRIHRDLKPDNMLVTENWRVKIADFGTAKLLATNLLSKHTESIISSSPTSSPFSSPAHTTDIGTPCYMAPELSQKGISYGPEVDVFSFGISIWVICEDTLPYKEIPHTFSIVTHVRKGGRPSLLLHIPEDLSTLMQRCWDGEPNKRPSFVEVLDELQRIRLVMTRPLLS